MITFSPKQKFYLISGGFLVAIILIFAAVVFPLIKKIKSSSLDLERQKVASENFYQNWKNLAESKGVYEQLQEELTSQGAFLPKNEALKFIMATEKMGQETGNRLNISIANTPTLGEENALKLQMSLSGNFSNLLDFLAQIETAPYFNNINSLQISRVSTKGDPENKTGDINSAIDLDAYYQ